MKIETLFTAEKIAERTAALGAQITRHYTGKPLTLVALMNGALPFAADLLRCIDLPLWLDSIGVASYHECRSTGELCFRSSLKLPPQGRHILLVDEVLDSGTTLSKVRTFFQEQGAESVRCAVLVEKELMRPTEIAHADWCCFTCPDRYLIGCGLDADEEYRNLPYIGVMAP